MLKFKAYRQFTSVLCSVRSTTSKACNSLQLLKATRSIVCSRSMSNNPFDQDDVSKFLDDAYSLVKEKGLKEGTSLKTPVIQFKHPKELEAILDLEIKKDGSGHETLLQEMEKFLEYSVKSGHPHFYNQLYKGVEPYSQAASWVVESVNCNIHTYEACPVHIVIEKYLFKRVCDIIGFSDGDGTFCPGGSASNFLALHLARFKKYPETKTQGLFNLPVLRCYSHEDSHYSLKKGANYLGFGVGNCVSVKTDERGRMMPEDLEDKIKQDIDKGYVPLMVMATSGSTVLGSYDVLADIADVCQKYNIWLHNDACWGGGALLSKKHKHLLKDIERCDSVAWNFHKFTCIPVQCSAMLVNNKEIMKEANSYKAEYLFMPDKFYDTSYDIGDKSMQCGRKPDGYKLWLMWKAVGDSGMEALVDKGFDNARYLTEKLKRTPGFRLVLPQFECTNICFWYIPSRLRDKEETDGWWEEIKLVAPKIKEKMMKSGTMMTAYQPLSSKGFVNFFRIIINNPLNEHSDMDFIIEEIDKLGRDL